MDIDDFKKLFKSKSKDGHDDGGADIEELKLHIDLLQKQLAKAKQQNDALSHALEGARHLETERDKYRAVCALLCFVVAP
jgi:hypothetical protein